MVEMRAAPPDNQSFKWQISCSIWASMESLSIFIRVVEAGSFTAAARTFGSTPSAVSKSMARLEARLGVRLFQRSTRAFGLTAEGEAYFDRVAPLVRGIQEADVELRSDTPMTGPLRISMPADFGRLLLDAVTERFLPAHPGIRLEISLNDRRVDLIREGFDMALRVGRVADTGLIAKPLGILPMVLVASPDYVARRGVPATVAALEDHDHIRYILAGRPFPIQFLDAQFIPHTGVLDTDSGEALRIAARNGLGIAHILQASVEEDLAAGRLERLLPEISLTAVPVQLLHAYARAMPARARAMTSFLAGEIATYSSR